MQAPSLVCMHALSCAVAAVETVETVMLLDHCIYWHPCNPRLIIAYAVADTIMFWLTQPCFGFDDITTKLPSGMMLRAQLDLYLCCCAVDPILLAGGAAAAVVVAAVLAGQGGSSSKGGTSALKARPSPSACSRGTACPAPA